MALHAATIFELYLAYLGRPPDAYATTFDQHLSAAALGPEHFFIFSESLEYAWVSATVLPTTPADIVQQAYQRLFDRSPEPAGVSYWLSLVASGQLATGDLPIAILQAAGGPDATSVQAKLAASRAFFNALDTPREKSEFAGGPAANVARDFLATIGAPGPVGTPEEIQARLEAAVSEAVRVGQAPGETFRLASQADKIDTIVPTASQHTWFGVSTSGRDSFLDEFAATALPTRFDGDRVDGGGATDTLTISAFNTSTARAEIVNVEVVNTAFSVAGDVLDLSGVRDLESVVLYEGSPPSGLGAIHGSATLTGLDSAVLVKATLNTAGPGLIIEYADRALPDQTVNLDLSGSAGHTTVGGALTLPDIEHLVIKTGPRFNVSETTLGAIHAAQAQTLTINADAPLALGALDIAAGGKVVINSDSYVRTIEANLTAGAGGQIELAGSAGMFARIEGLSSFVSSSSGAVTLEVVSGDSSDVLHVEERGTGAITVKDFHAHTLVVAVGGPQSDVFEQLAPRRSVFTGAGGADDYVFAEASERSLVGGLVGGSPVITDFGRRPGEPGDRIHFAHPLALTTNSEARPGVARIDSSGIATFDASDSSLAQKVEAVYAGIRAGGGAGTNSYALFADGGDTYVFKGSSEPEFGYGGTNLVRLSGVHLEAGQFGVVDGALTAL